MHPSVTEPAPGLKPPGAADVRRPYSTPRPAEASPDPAVEVFAELVEARRRNDYRLASQLVRRLRTLDWGVAPLDRARPGKGGR